MFYLRFHWLCLWVAKFLCQPDYKLQSPIIELSIYGGVAMKVFCAVTEVYPVEFKEVFIRNLPSWWDLLMGFEPGWDVVSLKKKLPWEQQPSLCSSCQRPSGLLYTC